MKTPRKQQLLTKVMEQAIVAVVREETAEAGLAVAQAYASAGLRSIEVTLTTPEALSIITRIANDHGSHGVIVAAGTCRSANDAAAARKAGAQILVSPHTDNRVIEYATEHDMLCVAGATTTTEIIRAWETGADIIKVYPVMHLGGPSYIKTIRQPIRDVPMLAGGPVGLDQIEAYLDAGAVAINLGGSLAEPALVAAKNWKEIASRAATALSIVQGRAARLGHAVAAVN